MHSKEAMIMKPYNPNDKMPSRAPFSFHELVEKMRHSIDLVNAGINIIKEPTCVKQRNKWHISTTDFLYRGKKQKL